MTHEQFLEAARYAVSTLDPEQVREGWNVIGRRHLYKLPYDIERDILNAMDDWCDDNGIDPSEWEEIWSTVDVFREGCDETECMRESWHMNEARESNAPAENPELLYWKKIDLFCMQRCQNNLLIRWSGKDRQYKETQLMNLLLNNFPYQDRPGVFRSVLAKKLPWGDEWINGVNQKFDTMLTYDMFRENFYNFQPKNKFTDGVRTDQRMMKMMETNGNKGKQAKDDDSTVEVVSSFADLYNVLTNPVNDALYGKKYKRKSITGRRGHPVRNGTFIEFNMKKMPVIVVRGSKQPFSAMVAGMSNCYALVGMERPGKDESSLITWFNRLKSKFKQDILTKGFKRLDYRRITPCSIEYWMSLTDEASKVYSDRDRFGMSAARKTMFKKTTILQLREDGSYRMYFDGLEDDDRGWQPDPMQNLEYINMIEDEFGVGSLDKVKESNAIRMNSRIRRRRLFEDEELDELSKNLAKIKKAVHEMLYDEFGLPKTGDNIRYEQKLVQELIKREHEHNWQYVLRNIGNEYLKNHPEVHPAYPITRKRVQKLLMILFPYDWYPDINTVRDLVNAAFDGREFWDNYYKRIYDKREEEYIHVQQAYEISKVATTLSTMDELLTYLRKNGYNVENGYDVKTDWSLYSFAYESMKMKGRGKRLFEAKGLTPEEKMDRWHEGARKENIKACSEEKLKEYRKICKTKGYSKEVSLINAELKRRRSGEVSESVKYPRYTDDFYGNSRRRGKRYCR